MLEEIRKKETNNKKRQENMACKFAKNFIFFPSIDGLVLCMYLCMYVLCWRRPTGGPGRDGGSPALVDSHVSLLLLPPPRARPPAQLDPPC